MLLFMLETLTGIGLATSAGLNAYIPLMVVGLLGRYTHLITLPGPWHWLTSGWVLAILALLLAIEFVADKIPLVDHANDVIQTVVRPTAGGLAFGAASSAQTVTVSDPSDFFSNHQWVPIVAGVVISFLIHAAKSSARPVVNASTAGFGAPVASTAEDIVSVLMSVVAIVFPVLIVLFLVLLVWFFIGVRRRRRRRKEARRTRQEASARARQANPGAHDGQTRTINLWS
jgi:hypothetical protein